MRVKLFYYPTDLNQTAGRMALSATRIEEPLPLCTRLINFSLSGPYSRHLYSILITYL